MRRPCGFASLACLLLLTSLTPLTAGEKEDGFESIFDGKTLDGWDGNPKLWHIEDGAITGQTTKDNPTKGNTFIIWTGGETADFELKLQYRIIGGNSGIQYRSFRLKDGADKWRIGGYQGDFEAGDTYSGILYGEKFRGILARRGDKTVVSRTDGKVKVTTVGSVGDTKEIQAKIKKEDWNDYHIIAKGFHFVHKINGVLTIDCTDNDEKERRASGILALQLHAGPPMKVQFRNIRIKHSKPANKSAKLDVKKKGRKTARKVVLIAGVKSHGYGAHEHKAGCMLLAEALNASGLSIEEIGRHTSELQSRRNLVCRLLLEKKKTTQKKTPTP